MIEYKIIKLDKDNAQITVEYNNKVAVAIDLPIDDNNNIPEGQDLVEYINYMAPRQALSRISELQKLSNNIDNLEALLVPMPEDVVVEASPEVKEALADKIRKDRNERLKKSDWTQIPDNGLDLILVDVWAEYRKLLRDIPQQPEFPDKVAYPIKPTEEAR